MERFAGSPMVAQALHELGQNYETAAAIEATRTWLRRYIIAPGVFSPQPLERGHHGG